MGHALDLPKAFGTSDELGPERKTYGRLVGSWAAESR